MSFEDRYNNNNLQSIDLTAPPQVKSVGGAAAAAERAEAVANIRHAVRQQQHSLLLLPSSSPASPLRRAQDAAFMEAACRLDSDLCAAFFLAHR